MEKQDMNVQVIWNIRDSRGLNDAEKAFLFVVASRGVMFTSWQVSAEDMGMKKDKFYRARTSLKKKGLISEGLRANDTTVYKINEAVLETFVPEKQKKDEEIVWSEPVSQETEAPVRPSEELAVQNDQVVIPAPENPIVGQDDATEETPEERAKRLAETQAVLDEDDFGDYTPGSEPDEDNRNDSVTVEIPAGLMSEEATKLFLDPSFKPGQTEDMRIRWANTYAVPEPVSVTANTTDDGDEW